MDPIEAAFAAMVRALAYDCRYEVCQFTDQLPGCTCAAKAGQAFLTAYHEAGGTALPEGMVAVPRKPTGAMREAGWRVMTRAASKSPRDVWAAMIAATEKG